MLNIFTKLRTLLIATTLCCTQSYAVAEEEYWAHNPPPVNLIEASRISSITLHALNLYREARSESDASMLMIMAVVFNRIDDSRFPNNHEDVILQNRAFSWTNDLIYSEIKNKAQYKRAYRIAEQGLMNQEILKLMSQGATHYHEKSIKPYWVNKDMTLVARIDRHMFYRWEKK